MREVVLDAEVVLGPCTCGLDSCKPIMTSGHLPPGLWLAVRRMPPVALRLRMR
jgi:hypothetical protein